MQSATATKGSNPTRLGRYKLIQRIATGGMAEVWRASAEGPAGFSKEIVIKKILPHLATDPRFVNMFLEEARLAARINHPNVVQIFELGQDRDVYYMVMEYVRGTTLRALLSAHQAQKTVPSPFIAARLLADAAYGLHSAHELLDESGNPLKLIHRDVSPDNILVSYTGEVKVADFGIARAASTSSFTNPGAVRGKMSYMAPERFMDEELDRRVDIYSLGLVLFELLTLERAHGDGENAVATILKGIGEKKDGLLAKAPAQLAELTRRAMSHNREDRPSSALSVAQELESFLKGNPVSARDVGQWAHQWFPPQKDLASVSPMLETAEPSMSVSRDVRGRPWGILFGVVAVVTATLTLGLFYLAFDRQKNATLAKQPDVQEVIVTPLSDSVPKPELPTPTVQHEVPPPPSEPVEATVKPTPPVKHASTPKRVAKQSKPAPALAEPGTLLVRVHPWADVVVDGSAVGVTPLAKALSLSPGPHTVKLVNSELGKTVTRNIVIRSGTQSVLQVSLLE